MSSKKLDLGSTLRTRKKKDVKKIERVVEAVHNEPTKRITFDVPQSMHIKIKQMAIGRGMTIREFLTGHLNDTLDL